MREYLVANVHAVDYMVVNVHVVVTVCMFVNIENIVIVRVAVWKPLFCIIPRYMSE